MSQQIEVMDENGARIGGTFPRRAKQLVGRGKAVWRDGGHAAITLIPGRETSGAGAFTETVKDVYRDGADEVLAASPFALIKRSKRRTRELHASFSLVLWSGAAIIYFLWNYFTGNTDFMLNPSEWASTWLIFVFAALAECLAERFFCVRELAVLDENIDLRQLSPAADGDLNLRGYRKRLVRKIRLTSSAALWLPLALIFFFGGYAFGLWGVAWVVFPAGLFIELLANFIGKLKQPA